MDICDRIAKLCLNTFCKLPKNGKPLDNEWTVLSCIVKENNSELEVITLGTGSKCISSDKMSKDGAILNDSHAEVICRRSFLLYLYHQILISDQEVSIFNFKINTFELKDNIKFHFFTTLMPCGDCSIFPKEEIKVGINSSIKRTISQNEDSKRLKIEDIHRTGAKCLPSDERQDPKGSGFNYHITGVVRTKPGRGPPTLSVSCSDKITKWCYLGIQGSILSLLIKSPIYLTSIIIVGNTVYSKESITRALRERFSNDELKCNLPNIYQANSSIFDFQKDDNRRVCASSISWCKIDNEIISQVIVEGRRQGVTSKNLNKPKLRLNICKKELFNKFMQVLQKFKLDFLLKCEKLTYYECKQSALEYQKCWKILKEEFKHWPVKDNQLLQFVSDTS